MLRTKLFLFFVLTGHDDDPLEQKTANAAEGDDGKTAERGRRDDPDAKKAKNCHDF